MITLGLESSCDDTACGIVRDGRHVMASVVASQIEVHRQFGGVVPEIASRQHLTVIDNVAKLALKEAGIGWQEIDAIGVTQGPGLIGALLVGISYAKGLAAALEKPLVPVDHVHAHVHGALLNQDPVTYPALSLVVSGGHTNLYRMNDPLSFQLIARTIDDACGECFDKVAKLLGFSYPGGPVVEQQARLHQGKIDIPMPRMVEEKSRLAFSYSGLKTHMVTLLRKNDPDWIAANIPSICAAFQNEALGQLVRKLTVALEQNPDIRTLVIAGGVSANQTFRTMLEDAIGLTTVFPDLNFCSDNGAMIAGLAYYHWQQNPQSSPWHWSKGWDAYARYQY